MLSIAAKRLPVTTADWLVMAAAVFDVGKLEASPKANILPYLLCLRVEQISI